MRTLFLILIAVALLPGWNAAAGQTSGTNLLHELPSIVNAVPGVSNWAQKNLPASAKGFLQNLTNKSGTNHFTSPSNAFPALSNWVATNSSEGGTNSMAHISNWFGTNVSASGTNTFQEFTNWLGTNYSRTLTNDTRRNPPPAPSTNRP